MEEAEYTLQLIGRKQEILKKAKPAEEVYIEMIKIYVRLQKLKEYLEIGHFPDDLDS